MPRLHDETVDLAFYLYPSEDAAKAGKQAGGCGFVILKPFDRLTTRGALILITNKHVVQQGHRFVRLNRADGSPPDVVEIEDNHYFPHRGPHDVAAILGIGNDTSHQIRRHIAYDQLFDSAKAAKDEYDIGIGDDTIMVGRFIGHDGKEINRPSIRFGNISVDVGNMYNTEAGYDEESYAVEMKSKPGYSGSAVLVYTLRGSSQRKSENKEFVMCLGVNWGHIVEARPLLDANGKEVEPRQTIKAPSDMAGVVPSWRIKELLNYADVKALIGAIEAREIARIGLPAISPETATGKA
jgi:hypothetical protein